jgi:hypothetical protein
MMAGPYLNDPGHEVPENTILVIPHDLDKDGFYKDVVYSLKGETKRDWFNEHFYYCLPINIGNQYGFVIKSTRDFSMTWDGSTNNANDILFEFPDDDSDQKQVVTSGFSQGVVTIQNRFALKTSPGINLMTIQPPNMFIPGCVAMTGVIETDNIRRDFTFNIKITIPNYKINVKKGDALGAFIPVPRYFIDNFNIDLITNIFDKSYHEAELQDSSELNRQRISEDLERVHQSGRKYFGGTHAFGQKYTDHQKRIK